jgi:zinc protease
LEEFHRQFYGVAAAEAVFVGSVDRAALTALLDQLFGKWESQSPYQRVRANYKAVEGNSQTFITPDKANSVFKLSENVPVGDDDKDYPALLVGNEILGGGILNSRLATRVRQRDGLSYSIGSVLWLSPGEPVGWFSVSAICAPQNMAHVERDIREEIAQALARGFKTAEVAAAKSSISQSMFIGWAADATLASVWASHLYLGRNLSWDEHLKERIAAVTPEEVQRAMRGYLDPSKMVTVKVGDFHDQE